MIQIRTQDVMPEILGPKLIPVMRRFASELALGALLTVDELHSRIRILPIIPER